MACSAAVAVGAAATAYFSPAEPTTSGGQSYAAHNEHHLLACGASVYGGTSGDVCTASALVASSGTGSSIFSYPAASSTAKRGPADGNECGVGVGGMVCCTESDDSHLGRSLASGNLCLMVIPDGGEAADKMCSMEKRYLFSDARSGPIKERLILRGLLTQT